MFEREESARGSKLKPTKSLEKKNSRHHVIALSFPKRMLFLFFFYLLLYGALLIVSLNQSKILDDTLLKKLKNGDHFNKLRLKNYEAFSLLNDLKLNFNLTKKGNDDITKLLSEASDELNIIVNLDGDLTTEERKIWRELLQKNLCQDLIDATNTKICEKIGEGILTKGTITIKISYNSD
ncbi:MAG: hypothetical protein QG594_244 [Bacteroidota bacterium]|nr:hypothetical protein [Bacteroidota bacterium]